MCSRLDEVSSIHYGKSPAEVVNSDGLFPIIGTGGEFGRASIPLFNAGVVVPRKGSLGNPQLALTPFWPTDTTFAVLPTEGIDIRWLYYCLLSYDLSRLNEATGVPSISRDWLSKIEFHNPGYKRQKRIAYILQTIDRAIEKTEALINKYQQIKAGLMHDLFTRGIGPNGQLRPPRDQAPELYHETPIGWIPKEWEFGTSEDVCEKIIDCKNRTPPTTPDGHPVIRTPNVRNGVFIDDALAYTDHESYQTWTARGAPRPGDIVITREAPVGEVCKIPERHVNACLGQRMMLYRIDPEMILEDFFLYVLQSRTVQNRLDLISGGSTVGHVRVGDIRTLWIFYPKDRQEQSHIVGALNAISSRLEAETNALGKLSMEKIGLMHDMLAGKVEIATEHNDTESFIYG